MSEEANNRNISITLIDKTADWLRNQAMADTALQPMLKGCFERLHAAGIPLKRAQIIVSVLHPLYGALGITWERGEGISEEGYSHFLGDDAPEPFKKSPYYVLQTGDVEFIRRRLEGVEDGFEFPVLYDLKKRGGTDYLAFNIPFQSHDDRKLMGSWLTDRKGGFSESEIAALLRMHDRLAIACKMAVQREIANNILETYLGPGAGHRVLNGLIKRGDGETTRAAIVYGDLRGSTALADQSGRQAYIEALNSFFDAAGGAIALAGGEVLSFMGDGFLAVFPCDRNRRESITATRKAYSAAIEAVTRMKDVNTQRTKNGEEPLGYGLSLHIGNVMFGNVGMADRLAYSVFGAAVNEAARLEAMTVKYKSPIIASGAFADYEGGNWELQGVEEFKGVRNAMEVFAPERTSTTAKPTPSKVATPSNSKA